MSDKIRIKEYWELNLEEKTERRETNKTLYFRFWNKESMENDPKKTTLIWLCNSPDHKKTLNEAPEFIQEICKDKDPFIALEEAIKKDQLSLERQLRSLRFLIK